jgi:hypothetical protein
VSHDSLQGKLSSLEKFKLEVFELLKRTKKREEVENEDQEVEKDIPEKEETINVIN